MISVTMTNVPEALRIATNTVMDLCFAQKDAPNIINHLCLMIPKMIFFFKS